MVMKCILSGMVSSDGMVQVRSLAEMANKSWFVMGAFTSEHIFADWQNFPSSLRLVVNHWLGLGEHRGI